MREAKMLKAYRKLNDIKAQDMADDLGITLTTYCKKENGKSEFTLTECKKIADKIGKSVDEIFFKQEVTY